jgi:hypothetical protein
LQVTWQENWKTCCSFGMKTLQPDRLTSYEAIYSDSNSKCSKYIVFEQIDAYQPRPGGSFSFWTGGTRKQCNGQYSWCFSSPVSSNRTQDSQMLTSGDGACVLGTRVRNANGKFEISFSNEDCNTKAQLFCVIKNKNIPTTISSSSVRYLQCSATYFDTPWFKYSKSFRFLKIESSLIKA